MPPEKKKNPISNQKVFTPKEREWVEKLILGMGLKPLFDRLAKSYLGKSEKNLDQWKQTLWLRHQGWSGQKIATHFSVTRQRVNQQTQAFRDELRKRITPSTTGIFPLPGKTEEELKVWKRTFRKRRERYADYLENPSLAQYRSLFAKEMLEGGPSAAIVERLGQKGVGKRESRKNTLKKIWQSASGMAREMLEGGFKKRTPGQLPLIEVLAPKIREDVRNRLPIEKISEKYGLGGLSRNQANKYRLFAIRSAPPDERKELEKIFRKSTLERFKMRKKTGPHRKQLEKATQAFSWFLTGRSQEETGKEMDISQASVSRLLIKAKSYARAHAKKTGDPSLLWRMKAAESAISSKALEKQGLASRRKPRPRRTLL